MSVERRANRTQTGTAANTGYLSLDGQSPFPETVEDSLCEEAVSADWSSLERVL